MFDDLQYNVYRFFEYWQQGIDEIFGSDNDNSNVAVPCPYYRDGIIHINASSPQSWFNLSDGVHQDVPQSYANIVIDSNSLAFIRDIIPLDYNPPYWADADRQLAANAISNRINDVGYNLGMDENHVGEPLYPNVAGDLFQSLITANSNYPLQIDRNNSSYYGTFAIVNGDDAISLDIDGSLSSPFIGELRFINTKPLVGVNISPREIDSLNNNYYEYHNHYTEDGITVYYSDDYTFITYEGDKTYNEVQNVVNNAYNNDNSVTIKVNAPSYETVKNGNRHPYYIAPLQPLQIPELGEMSLPAGEFGDAPKILAESVNEMTGLLDHLGLTAIFIVCALLVFIIRKVRD